MWGQLISLLSTIVFFLSNKVPRNFVTNASSMDPITCRTVIGLDFLNCQPGRITTVLKGITSDLLPILDEWVFPITDSYNKSFSCNILDTDAGQSLSSIEPRKKNLTCLQRFLQTNPWLWSHTAKWSRPYPGEENSTMTVSGYFPVVMFEHTISDTRIKTGILVPQFLFLISRRSKSV